MFGESADSAQLTFDLDFGTQQFSFKAENTKTRDEWVKEIADLTGVEVISESPLIHTAAKENLSHLTTALLDQSHLQMYSEGFWGRGKWTDRFVVLEEGTLNIFADERSFTAAIREPLERFHSFLQLPPAKNR